MSLIQSLMGLVDYYTTTHPTISSFEWAPPYSSLPLLLSAVASYILLTLLFSLLLPLPPFPPSLLKPISAVHNLILLLLSLIMSLSTLYQLITKMPSPLYPFCFPPSTPPSGPPFFWAYVFYLSKFYELLDTLLILISDLPSRNRRLTFLHVYHHSVVLIMCYVWLETVQSTMLIALATNASVHVVMYGYYLCASLGWRWSGRWKRVVTEVQIVQFVFSFVISGVFLWAYFWREEGCKGMKGWVFNAMFNVSLFGLFLDFHGKAYRERNKKEKKRVD